MRTQPAKPPDTVAERLRKRRHAAELTQHELAEQSGVSRSGIAKIELGIVHPELATLVLLSKALGVAVRELHPSLSGIA